MAAGASFADLGLDPAHAADPREVWRLLAANWHRFAGTASGYWLTHELAELFGITDELDAENADRLYDRVDARLADPDFTPRALFGRFRIEVLATTDDPLDSLETHALLAADPGFDGRVLPTFRPDAYLDPEADGFPSVSTACSTPRAAPPRSPATWRPSRNAGRTSSATAPSRPITACSSRSRSNSTRSRQRRCSAVRSRGTSTRPERARFRGHMLWQSARMSVADGLVMTVHPGVRRNHHRPTFERFGADTGHDIPVRTEYTENLRPLLERFGLEPGFHLVLFAVDETVSSREVAPLAGFYPSVYIGAPVVVPRCTRRHPALALRDHRDRRLLPLERIHRRHPGVPLHPGAA